MNCIDAAEGIAKAIIDRIYQVFTDEKLDDSEYIQNAKAVVEGADDFLKQNNELISDPKILKEVLYNYAKHVWLENRKQQTDDTIEMTNQEYSRNDGYDEYYFDHIYASGEYPR